MAEPRIPFAERFWAKVQKTDNCWNWTGATYRGGYGQVFIKPQVGKHYDVHELAHRVAWRLTHGAIPAGLHVLHHCDNPPCCNPDHLFLGTQLDNIRDMNAKGRQRNGITQGIQHGRAKLNDTDVLAIRSLYAAGGISQPTLADRYGVLQSTIWKIIHHKTWRHLM